MSRCIIIAAHCEARISSLVQIRADDTVICADGGYRYAQAEKLRVDVLLGDFDSLDAAVAEDDVEVVRVPAEKDDTDTMLCLRYAIEHGHDEIILVGGLGGRLDHTLANLQALAYGCSQGCFVLLVDSNNLVTMIDSEQVRVPRLEGFYLSVLSYSEACTGVCESGVKYPLEQATLSNRFPLGVSNEFSEEYATVSCASGQMLLILSRDPL